MREFIACFWIALGFLTRCPIPPSVRFSQQRLNRAAAYFPLIGLIVGGVGAVSFFAAEWLFGNAWLAALVSTAVTVMFTGAFHEDGFADVCDGVGGAFEVERKLAIMKDSRVGTYAVVGLLLLILTKVAALAELQSAALIIVAHVSSRSVAVSLMASLQYVRLDETSKVKPLAQHLSNLGLLASVGTGAVVVLSILPLKLALSVIITLMLVRALLARFFIRQLGGYTGDCLGAAQQVAEISVYLVVLAMSHGAWA